MADTKYVMLGKSASGKTCYITAMYMKMATGIDGFTLVTDDATRTKLERDIISLRQPNGRDRFPTATNEATTRSYEFKLSYETKKIITFELLDYAGGLLETRTGNYEEIKKSIEESAVLYIFIDGMSFCEEERENRKENVQYDAITITPLIQDFADTHNGCIPPIVFVVTKADLCKKYVAQDEIVSIIRDLFSPAFSEGSYTYVCAVSLGDTISDDNYKGRFKPINIHIPFFIGSYHEYYNMCAILGSEKKPNMELLEKSKKIFDKFSTRLEMESANFQFFKDGVEQEHFKRFEL